MGQKAFGNTSQSSDIAVVAMNCVSNQTVFLLLVTTTLDPRKVTMWMKFEITICATKYRIGCSDELSYINSRLTLWGLCSMDQVLENKRL